MVNRFLFILIGIFLPFWATAQNPIIAHIDNAAAGRTLTWNAVSPVNLYRVWVEQRNASSGIWQVPPQDGVFTVADTVFRYTPNITWSNLPTRLRILPLRLTTDPNAPPLNLEEKNRDAGVSPVFTPFAGSRTGDGVIVVIVETRPAPAANPCNALSDSLSRIIDNPATIKVSGNSNSFANLAQNLSAQYAGQYVSLTVKVRNDCTVPFAQATNLLYPQGGVSISLAISSNTAQTNARLAAAVGNIAQSVRSLLGELDNYNHSQAEQTAHSNVLRAGLVH